MTTLNISLPDVMKTFIEDETERSGFASASEYVRSLIREAQKKRAIAKLEDELNIGYASPEHEWTPERARMLRERVAETIKKARKR
jgi:antitoxin ParD1/3/4